jgi:hypothetical protein
MLELAAKVLILLSPVAETRHIWTLVQEQFATAVEGWNIIQTKPDELKQPNGNYFRVQFSSQNGVRTFISRAHILPRLPTMGDKLAASASFYANGKPVKVVYDGEGLDLKTCEPETYYIHVKAVNQYFTMDERRKRHTVIEQHHNVSKFYFDLPLPEGARTKRMVFTLPHPMPYIVQRVEIPPENVEEIIFSQIEVGCHNMREQIIKLEEAMDGKDSGSLAMILQGSLLPTVNCGAQAIAESLLSGLSQEQQNDPHVADLRAALRGFLDMCQKGLEM